MSWQTFHCDQNRKRTSLFKLSKHFPLSESEASLQRRSTVWPRVFRPSTQKLFQTTSNLVFQKDTTVKGIHFYFCDMSICLVLTLVSVSLSICLELTTRAYGIPLVFHVPTVQCAFNYLPGRMEERVFDSLRPLCQEHINVSFRATQCCFPTACLI